MQTADLRAALAAFLGEERFRKFVATGVPLRYWQELEWRRFCSARPEFAASHDELAVAIRICEVHGEELQPDEIELFDVCIRYTQEYLEARKRLFPHAATRPIPTELASTPRARVGVWYCPSCRAEKEKWNARQTRLPE